MNYKRSYHTATLLNNGQVLIVGGDFTEKGGKTAEIFDPETNTFYEVSKLKYPRIYHASVLLQDGRVLVIGALKDLRPQTKDRRYRTSINNIDFSKSRHIAEIFDPNTGDWSEFKLGESYEGIGGEGSNNSLATILPDGRVLWFGCTCGALIIDIDNAYSKVSKELTSSLKHYGINPSRRIIALPNNKLLLYSPPNFLKHHYTYSYEIDLINL